MKERPRFVVSPALCITMAVALLTSGLALAQRKGPSIQQGQWEIVVTITDISLMPKPPGGKFPSKGFQACLTQAQADDPVSFLSEVVVPMGPECRVGTVRQIGSRASWPLQCPQPKGTTQPFGGSGSFEFGRAAFEGTVKHARPVSAEKSLDTQMSVTGKRVGDC